MDQCPACNSYVVVAPGTPCYVCGVSLVELDAEQAIMVIPAHLVFDVTRSLFAKSVIENVASVTRKVIVDMSDLQLLTNDEASIVMALRMAAKLNEVRLVFARVNPSSMDIFAAPPLSDASYVVKTVDDGLNFFRQN
jgi:hypothetical protein